MTTITDSTGPSASASMITIAHNLIAPDVLAIARNAAALDPDGQIFPWRDGYPLAGSTVYWDFQLWTVAQNDGDMVLLVGCGHDAEELTLPAALRPVSWTQQLELEYFNASRARTLEIDKRLLDGLLAETNPPIERALTSEDFAPLFTDPEAR